MKLRACILGMLVLLLALAISPVYLSVQASPASQSGEEPPQPRRVYGPPDLSHPPELLDNLPAYKAQAGNLAWTALVFQLYTPSGWNIAYQPRDDNQVYLLTDDTASDVTPRLSPDGTRVAFASKVDKNYRIVVLNLTNGARQTLTEQLGDASSPFWSPDGGRIAFEWEQAGNSDIWMMNKDGSGLTRLTSDPDYDGMPSWSPDGSKLAFVSRRTGGYRVYVMNADGSNPVQLSLQPYSGDPVWSPDGKTIGYDADGDQDGWYELWIMDANGANQALVDKAYSGTSIDYMLGSWSPDGKMLAYSHVQWIQYPSGWYITESYIKSIAVFTLIKTNLTSLDTAMYPDWISMDRQAPTSQVLPLPSFARPGQIVSWLGSDTGGSGIDHYDVQTRDRAGGSWLDWISGTSETTGYLSKSGGHTYELRSRAQDTAFNLESWPLAADTVVTLYNWMIQGQVRNNRGAPAIFPTVQISGNPFLNQNDGTSGSYQIYAAQAAASYTANWQKTGYGSLPQTSFSGFPDARINPVLPPADNLIANGNFEAASLGVWTAAGDDPAVLSNRSAFTGLKGAWIGENNVLPFNDPMEKWDYNASLVTSTGIGIDDQNRVHLAWVNDNQMFYGIKKDGVWELSPIVIPGTDNSLSDSLNLQVSQNGVAHFTWTKDQRVNYRSYDHGIWTSVEFVSPASQQAGPSILKVEKNGLIHLVYYADITAYYTRRTGSNQWTNEYIGNLDSSAQLDFMLDKTGIVHIKSQSFGGLVTIWRGLNGGWTVTHPPYGDHPYDCEITDDGVEHALGSWNSRDLLYTYRLPGAEWSEPETVLSYYPGGVYHAFLAIGPDGQPRVLTANTNYQYLRRISANTWTVAEDVTPLDYRQTFEYEISPDGVDHLFVYWPFAYIQHTPGGSWDTIQEFPDDMFYNMDVRRDGLYRLHVFGYGELAFGYASPPLSATDSSSRLTQSMTIPANMPSPTLAYLVDYAGTTSAAGSGFSISLDDGANQTELNKLTASTNDWTQQWHDLSAWAGQTVTLTFQVDSAAGYYLAHASLDDVSLGAAYPSLWVRGGGDGYASPGEQISYELQAGAYNGPLAPNTVLTATLPAGWTYLGADPAPVVLGTRLVWQLGDLPGGGGPIAIRLDLECQAWVTMLSDLSITLEIHSDQTEIDLEDNQAVIPVVAAYPMYLPVIQR